MTHFSLQIQQIPKTNVFADPTKYPNTSCFYTSHIRRLQEAIEKRSIEPGPHIIVRYKYFKHNKTY